MVSLPAHIALQRSGMGQRGREAKDIIKKLYNFFVKTEQELEISFEEYDNE